MNKELWATVDYIDDILESRRHYTKDDLDALMKYLASIGTSCVEWIYDRLWHVYDADGPSEIDVLATACEAAHRHRLRFIVILKPFEGAINSPVRQLPGSLPVSENAALIEEPTGLIYGYRPEIAEHAEACVARMKGESTDPGGRITAIRLVKNDDAPSPFAPGDLSIWTSARNGGYREYRGPVRMEEGTDWRIMLPPHDNRPARIVTLGGLELPDETRFILLRREKGGGDFRNAIEYLVELVNERGGTVPSTPSNGAIDGRKVLEYFRRMAEFGLTRFAHSPEAHALLADEERFLSHCEGMHSFSGGWENFSFEAGCSFAVMRGKNRRRTGIMHPVYPQARETWLDDVRCCIECGADGINFRAANHNQVFEPRFFGFNPPVVEQQAHPGNFAEARRINGDAYTLFLREAADILHGAGLQMGVHVHGLMLRFSDRAPDCRMVPLNFEWQWERWIREFADFVEYRGAFFFRPENQRYITDRIGMVAREAGKPMIYQGMRGGPICFSGPHHATAYEMDWTLKHPDVAAYNLYETAYFTRYEPEKGLVGSPDIAELVRAHWLKRA